MPFVFVFCVCIFALALALFGCLSFYLSASLVVCVVMGRRASPFLLSFFLRFFSFFLSFFLPSFSFFVFFFFPYS